MVNLREFAFELWRRGKLGMDRDMQATDGSESDPLSASDPSCLLCVLIGFRREGEVVHG